MLEKTKATMKWKGEKLTLKLIEQMLSNCSVNTTALLERLELARMFARAD